MALLHCPFLGAGVELMEEREKHIAEHHPDLLPEHLDKMAGTLFDPDQVRRSSRFPESEIVLQGV